MRYFVLQATRKRPFKRNPDRTKDEVARFVMLWSENLNPLITWKEKAPSSKSLPEAVVESDWTDSIAFAAHPQRPSALDLYTFGQTEII